MEYSVFDTHCDTLCKILDRGESFEKNSCEVDLERMTKYGSYFQFMACFIAPEYRRVAKRRTLMLINTYNERVKNAGAENVKTALSIEGGEGIEDIETLEEFYSLGVRMAALTWNTTNHIGGGAHERNKRVGLSSFGKEVVKRMNELGMIADVSHLNDKSFYDVCAASTLPIVASHSCSRSECRHVRNITDDMFELIKKSGGCVGINLYPKFLTGCDKAVIDDVIRHIEHFMSLGGEKNVGIGADFDGVDGHLPQGIRGCEDLYKIFDRLLQLNYSENTVRGISYGNFSEIFKKIGINC